MFSLDLRCGVSDFGFVWIVVCWGGNLVVVWFVLIVGLLVFGFLGCLSLGYDVGDDVVGCYCVC